MKLKKQCIILVFFSIFLCNQYIEAQSFFQKDSRILNLENFDKKRWSWGFFLGINDYDFKTEYKKDLEDIKIDKNIGFNVGLIGNLRINDYIDLRLEPGVMFTERHLTFPEAPSTFNKRDVKSTYIHIPLLAKFSTKRLNNFKPFVVGGISGSWNLSSNEDNPDDNTAGEFRMNTHTFYYEVGIGIDFYLYYFKCSPSIRGVFALNNELKPDNTPNSPYTENIGFMGSRAIFLHLTFQ